MSDDRYGYLLRDWLGNLVLFAGTICEESSSSSASQPSSSSSPAIPDSCAPECIDDESVDWETYEDCIYFVNTECDYICFVVYDTSACYPVGWCEETEEERWVTHCCCVEPEE